MVVSHSHSQKLLLFQVQDWFVTERETETERKRKRKQKRSRSRGRGYCHPLDALTEGGAVPHTSSSTTSFGEKNYWNCFLMNFFSVKCEGNSISKPTLRARKKLGRRYYYAYLAYSYFMGGNSFFNVATDKTSQNTNWTLATLASPLLFPTSHTHTIRSRGSIEIEIAAAPIALTGLLLGLGGSHYLDVVVGPLYLYKYNGCLCFCHVISYIYHYH